MPESSKDLPRLGDIISDVLTGYNNVQNAKGATELTMEQAAGLRNLLVKELQRWIVQFDRVNSEFPVVSDEERDILERLLMYLVTEYGSVLESGDKAVSASSYDLNKIVGRSAELITKRGRLQFIVHKPD